MRADSFERFTRRSKLILSLAEEDARRFRQNEIGTEHLLLALIREEGSVASRVLRNLGMEMKQIEELVERLVPPSKHSSVDTLPLTREAKRVLELAADESQRMGNYFIGTEHLLLGLVRLKQGVAMDVLKKLQITPEALQEEVRAILKAAEDTLSSKGNPP